MNLDAQNISTPSFASPLDLLPLSVLMTWADRRHAEISAARARYDDGGGALETDPSLDITESIEAQRKQRSTNT